MRCGSVFGGFGRPYAPSLYTSRGARDTRFLWYCQLVNRLQSTALNRRNFHLERLRLSLAEAAKRDRILREVFEGEEDLLPDSDSLADVLRGVLFESSKS